MLTLGDIDPDTPALKVERIAPLARYLAPELAAVGVSDVSTRIAPSVDRMIEMLKGGEVDVYLDSLYPTLKVRQLSGSRVILATWVRKQREYHSIFVVRRDGRVRKLSDLRGRAIAFEEAHSTSGFFLPALHLRRGGHVVEELASADAKPEAGAIGYVFSGDAENTVERVLRGSVDAGAISNEDYDALPEASRARLTVLDPLRATRLRDAGHGYRPGAREADHRVARWTDLGGIGGGWRGEHLLLHPEGAAAGRRFRR